MRYPQIDWSDLHIDHIDPRDKPRGPIADTRVNPRASAENMLGELLKCQVLCREHHHDKHRNGNAHIEMNQLHLFNGSGGWLYEATQITGPRAVR